MKSVKDKFSDSMRSNGVNPPERIKADEEIHTYKTDSGAEYWYVLSLNRPVIGLFGQCNKSTKRRWSKRRKSQSDETAYQKKLTKLKRLVNKFRMELNENREPAKIIDRSTVKLKQLSLPFGICKLSSADLSVGRGHHQQKG